jgi:hypothetical protein
MLIALLSIRGDEGSPVGQEIAMRLEWAGRVVDGGIE